MLKKLQHVAIIMDGNGRWAQLRDKPRTFGHIKGARVAKKIITQASDMGLKNLTMYAFSSENWLRPQTEVKFLMTLLSRYLKKESANLHKKNIRFNVIGEVSKLPAEIQKAIATTKELTKNNTGLNLSFALSYGSRQELILAAQALATKVKKGELAVEQINEKSLSDCLMTSGTPDPDLIIRTSGESRLSNFLMWQASYSELFFSPILWPDYTAKDFNTAIQYYMGRDRRFGKVLSKNEESFI
ncbi:MAG: isoprenyl transferase [Pseudobdellovibrio sp.]